MYIDNESFKKFIIYIYKSYTYIIFDKNYSAITNLRIATLFDTNNLLSTDEIKGLFLRNTLYFFSTKKGVGLLGNT